MERPDGRPRPRLRSASLLRQRPRRLADLLLGCLYLACLAAAVAIVSPIAAFLVVLLVAALYLDGLRRAERARTKRSRERRESPERGGAAPPPGRP